MADNPDFYLAAGEVRGNERIQMGILTVCHYEYPADEWGKPYDGRYRIEDLVALHVAGRAAHVVHFLFAGRS